MSPRRQKGFVLVLALWILAAITIAASFFADRVEKSLGIAQQRQDNGERLIEMNNARAEILFRLSTTRFFQWGLGARGESIALDDRPYRVPGGFIQLQDERGLFNINATGAAQEAQIFRFLAAFDIPADQRPRFVDTLQDYIDEDNLRRANGAEEREYEAAGLPPPRNAPLITPLELRRVLAWRDSPQLWGSVPVSDLVAAGQSGGINPNTASWQALVSLPGVTPEIARQVIVRREIDPSVSPDMLAQMTGIDPIAYMFSVHSFPANRVRITQRAPGLPWAIRYNVALSPLGERAPWTIDSEYRIEQKEDLTRGSAFGRAAELPPWSAVTSGSQASVPGLF